jgi:hypothetical protein
MDEGKECGNVIGNKMFQVDLVEVEQSAEEVAHGDPKPSPNVREEGDGLIGPLDGERLAGRWPLAHLLLGLQQPAGRQDLGRLFHHGGRLPNALRHQRKIGPI